MFVQLETIFSQVSHYNSLFSAKSSRSVLRHILKEGLSVEVYWVGERMEEVMDRLDGAGENYLVLSHTPSTLTSRHALTPLMFPACRDPLLRRDEADINCLYAPHRLAKVVWSPVQNEAPALFR